MLICTLVFALLLPAYFAYLSNAHLESGVSDYWTGVRVASVAEERTGLFDYIAWSAHILCLITFYETIRKRIPRWQCAFAIVVTLIYSLAGATRLGALRLVFALLAIAATATRRLRFTMLLTAGMAVLLVFIPMAILLNKGGDRRQSVEENVLGIVQSLQDYTLGGLVAFDNARVGRISQPDGFRSLRFFYSARKFFGDSTPVPRMAQPFTDTPRITNIYTIYYTYFLDYGWFGTMVALAAIGFLSAALFHNALRGSPVATVLYGLVLSCLLLSNSDEYFLTGLSANIQAIMIVNLIYRLDVWLDRKHRQHLLIPRHAAVSTCANLRA